MLTNMKPWERMLFGATVGAIVLYLAWSFGISGIFGALASGSSQVKSLEKTFLSNLRSLENIYTVEKAYRNIAQAPVAGKDVSPAIAFQNEVFDISQRMNFQFPTIHAQASEIKGVEDYQLLSVTLQVKGAFADIVKLLKAYDAAGLIFSELKLTVSRDSDQITANMVVARIAEKPVKKSAGTSRWR
ncbi:hypothetical protein BH09SUM1_BH09SUM1_24340 [soil metagenome]